MSTLSHGPGQLTRGRSPHWIELLDRDVWVSLAITVMWLAVLFDAVFGPNIESSSAGGSSSSVPSAVAVAFFAFLGTWVLARYGLGERGRRTE